jgi:hypothetical protein
MRLRLLLPEDQHLGNDPWGLRDVCVQRPIDRRKPVLLIRGDYQRWAGPRLTEATAVPEPM